MIKLFTSYFAKTKQLIEEMGLKPVCVAGYAPKFFYDVPEVRFYPDLAPRREWWLEWKNKHLSNEWYIERYNDTVLSNLNPEKVLSDLGDNAVMLCYEKPGDFCHRHLIAEWLERTTGVNVKEIQF